MKILAAMLAVLGLAGCATTTFSSLDTPDNKPRSNLIVANYRTVRISITHAIEATHPGSRVHEEANGTYVWSLSGSASQIDFRIHIFAGIGLDENNKKILGLFYTVDTDTARISYYMPSLQRAIDGELQSRGARTIKVKLLSTLPAQEESKKLAQQVHDCFAHMDDNPSLAILNSKLKFEDGNATFAMMTNASKPTAEERQAILRWGQSREKCLSAENTANDWIGMPSQLEVLRNSLITSQQALIARLYMGNLTYAEFASKMQTMTNNYREHSTEVTAEIKNAVDEKRDRERQIEATRSLRTAIEQSSTRTCSYGGGTIFCY